MFQDFNVTGKSLTFEATSFDYGWVGTMTVSGGSDVTISDMRLAGGTLEPGGTAIFAITFELTLRFDVKPEDEIGPQLRARGFDPEDVKDEPSAEHNSQAAEDTRAKLRKRLRAGELDDREIEVETAINVGVDIMAPPGMEEMGQQLRQMFSQVAGNKTHKRTLSIRTARPLLVEEEAARLVNEDEVRDAAIEACEQHGIVFIDEIDKVAKRGENVGGGDVSREGVQRDLLPLVEGSTVSTKYGSVKTDHILFIASGAFHLAKPSDLIPELQGRFPIRVELGALSKDDFVRILTEPKAALTLQYVELLKTEGVTLAFAPDAIDRLAEIAALVNERQENIGARRLHTVLERLLDTLSYDAPDKDGTTVAIDRAYVDAHLGELVKDPDLSRYIL